jgi:hypothetical protein
VPQRLGGAYPASAPFVIPEGNCPLYEDHAGGVERRWNVAENAENRVWKDKKKTGWRREKVP